MTMEFVFMVTLRIASLGGRFLVSLLVESLRLCAGRSTVTLLKSRKLFVATVSTENGTHMERKFTSVWVTTTPMDLELYKPERGQELNVIAVTAR
jgi:hypothetical protein